MVPPSPRLADLRGRAAHDPGQADRPGAVDDEQVVGIQPALDVVEGGQGLPGRSAAHPDAAGEASRVVGVQRLAELEHHVVGDVHDQGDRAHAGGQQPPLQPPRARGGRVDAVDPAGDEPRAGRVVQLDRPRVALRRRHLDPGRGVDEVGVERARELAGEAAHREAVAAVRGDGQLDHRVVQAQQHRRVLAGRRRARREHEDPGVVGADAELARRGDHAVRHVPVGLAGRDRETAGQHGAGQRDHHEVADREVAGAADDAARPVVAVVGAGVDRHHRIGFLSPVSSSISTTRPATSGPRSSGPRWTSSTSRPTRTNASPTASASVGRPSTWAASQDRGTRTIVRSWDCTVRRRRRG